MPQMDSHYMFSDIFNRKPGARTDQWGIYSSSSGVRLGIVRWLGPWRQYIFAPDERTSFNHGCLAEIATFLVVANDEHRNGRKR